MMVLSFTAYACEIKDKICIDPANSKLIEGEEVYRDCWKYSYKYDCSSLSKNDCGEIDPNICTQIKEKECIKYKEIEGVKFCTNYKLQFSCKKQIEWEEEIQKLTSNGKEATSKDIACASMCLDGNCSAVKKAPIAQSNEIGKAAALLESLKDIKSDIKNLESFGKDAQVFSGYGRSCSEHPLNFMSCCRVDPSGWGEAIGFGICTPDEKQLAGLKKDGRCVYIGSYCETRFLGCIDERHIYCCYDSIISKIINQEAKKQLGISNGTPENPNCGSIKLCDLEKVDLSQADFTEFYEKVVIPSIKLKDEANDSKSASESADQIKKDAKKLQRELQGFSRKFVNGNEK